MITATSTPASTASSSESAATGGGTKMPLTSAPVSATASATLSKTGRPRWVVPPLPGVTPPTICVPVFIASSAWNVACWPVKPWMMTFESLSTKTLMRAPPAGGERRPSRPRRPGPRPGSGRGRSRRGCAGLPRRSCRRGARRAGTSISWSRVACTTPVAIQSQRLMPAKMFTRIARTFGSWSTMRNAFAIFSGVAPPPTSRKFAGPAAVVRDRVHRAHREAGAVHDAADRAVERDVVQPVARGLDLLRVLLVEVAQLDDVGLAEERVVVEAHLRVERDEVAVLGHR